MPRQYETFKDTYVGLRLPKELVETVDGIAEIEFRSRSNMIEVLLRMGLGLYKSEQHRD